MGIGPAQLLGADHLAGGGLHQRRAAQEDGPLPAHDDALVGHGRHIGPAGGAGAHDAGDLGDAVSAHPRLVVEDAAEMVAVGEDLGLVRQVGPARIDQIDARQPVLRRDLLGAQVLLHGQREIGAALHRGVVGDDHHLAAGDAADAGDDAGARRLAVIEAARGQRADLEKGRAGVQQPLDPLARQKLAARCVARPRRLRPAKRRLRRPRPQAFDQGAVDRQVARERVRERVDGGGQFGQGRALVRLGVRLLFPLARPPARRRGHRSPAIRPGLRRIPPRHAPSLRGDRPTPDGRSAHRSDRPFPSPGASPG